MLNVVCVLTFPGTGDGVMMIVGRGTGITVTDVETVIELPPASTTVALIRYVAASLKTWVTVAVPETAPRSCVALPSPQFMVRSRTALPLVVAGVTTIEKAAGNPALGLVVGGVIDSVGPAATPTVTVPEACPAVVPATGVVVVPQLAGAPCAPTLAVTVAVVDVLRVVCAWPF